MKFRPMAAPDDLDPPPPDSSLWRYMDFAKFVSLLDRQSLFFARADKLDDPFEGAVPKKNVDERGQIYRAKYSDHKVALERTADVYRKLGAYTLVNCWNEANHESAGMWKLYSSLRYGVAVRTDLKCLKNSVIEDVKLLIGRIRYIDYERMSIPEGNSVSPFLYKRTNFEDEREVRAIIQKWQLTDDQRFDLSQDVCDIGEYFRVCIASLVREVLVSPYAEDWFLDLVRSIAARYNLEAPVAKSVLAERPPWN